MAQGGTSPTGEMVAMDGGPLGEPEDLSPRRARRIRAAWCVAGGAIGCTAVLICLAVGVLTAQRAIALGLPAALLLFAGLVIAAAPDPAAGRRAGFKAGFLAGSLLTRLRFVFRRRPNGN
jgi:hypothetical protein